MQHSDIKNLSFRKNSSFINCICTVADIIKGIDKSSHFGFEECTYLLLFGKLPTKEELQSFCALLSEYRTLPTSFVRDIIMKAPSKDMMNTLARSVLTLYSYDDRADDITLPNVLRQCLQLISLFPLLSVYGYQAYNHYHDGASLFIHAPQPVYCRDDPACTAS